MPSSSGCPLGQQARHHLAQHELGLEQRQGVAAPFRRLGDLVDRGRELVERQRARLGRLGAAAPGQGARELGRLDAGHAGDAFADGVQARELRLQLAEPDRERVDVLAHERVAELSGCAANDAIQFCTTGSRASRPRRSVT